MDKEYERLMFDYERAYGMIQHYEQLNWQVGSVLFAGIFLMIGLSLEKLLTNLELIPFVVLAVIAVDLFWFLWYQRNILLIYSRSRRMKEIERIVPELKQLSFSLEDDQTWGDATIKDGFGEWLRAYMRHRVLIRWFCFWVPTVLVLVYCVAFSAKHGLDINVVVISLLLLCPLSILFFYPVYPSKKNPFLDDDAEEADDGEDANG